MLEVVELRRFELQAARQAGRRPLSRQAGRQELLTPLSQSASLGSVETVKLETG